MNTLVHIPSGDSPAIIDIWNRFIRTGLNASLDNKLKRKVTLSNQISILILLVVCLSAAVFQFFHGTSWLVWAIAALNLIPIGAIALNRKSYTTGSRLFLCVFLPVAMLLLIVMLKYVGSDFGFNVSEYHFYTPRYYMVIVSLLPLFLLDISERRAIYFALGVNVACILMFDSFHELFGVSPMAFGFNFDNYFQATIMPMFLQVFMYASIITYQLELNRNETKINRLVNHLEKHNTRIQSEINLAKNIIEGLLPAQLPKLEKLQIAGYLTWCNEVGGDYYTVRPMKNGKYLMVMADVSGKGLGASIIVSTMHSSIETQLSQGNDDLKTLVMNLNQVLFSTTGGERFVTSWLAVYDPETAELESVNAGHLPPVIASGKGEPIRLLSVGGPLLGILGEEYDCKVETFKLEEGDVLCSFTDGVTEAAKPDGEMYEMDRVQRFLQLHKNDDPKNIIPMLTTEVRAFTQRNDFEDDFAVLVLKQS